MTPPTLGTGYEPAPEPTCPKQPDDDTPASQPSGKTASRFGVINAIIDHALSGLKRNELAVWLVLWRFTDAKTGVATVPYAAVAERVGTSTKTVVRVVKRLRAAGLVTVVRQGGYGKGPSVLRVVARDTPKVP
jgi:hypothetical protein